MADLIGKQLGNYEILGLLGQGGMAVVYRARDTRLNREVAIKVIHPEMSDAQEFLKRFELEARTVASLSHPHVLKVYDYGSTDDGMVYLVMELLGGGSLAGAMRKEQLSLSRIVEIAEQVAGALDYAHNRMIVHRDLKPQNVLLDETGNAFLTDFGIAKLLDKKSDLTQTGSILGTPGYMAPEVWRGDEIDGRADIYAFGVMLYELITGRLPFAADTPFNIMYKHLHEMPTPIISLRQGIPPAIQSVIDRAMAKSRENRYDSAMAVVNALREVIAGATGQFTIPRPISDEEQRAQPTINVTPGFDPQATPMFQAGATLTPAELQGMTFTPPEFKIASEQIREQERKALAGVDSELRKRTPRDAMRPRFINPLPNEVGDRFRDRVRQQADIVNLLIEQTRLVSIYGRGGVGKTALASRVLANLQRAKGDQAFSGMVYLSTNVTGIAFERILADFLRLLDGDARQLVEIAQLDPSLSVAQKTEALIRALSAGRYVLLLDNLELFQNPETGELRDPDLKAFIETVLGNPGTLRLLVTSREPIQLPRALKGYEKLVPLEAGLPREDAIDLLRTLDADGAAGVRDAAEEQLGKLIELLGGLPRALEAAVGLLLEDPTVTLDDVLEDVSIMRGEVVSSIVQQAINHLSAEAQRVMEALAVFRRPVTQTALEYVLAPFITTANLRGIMARLLRGHFASYNNATQTFAIHPIDREYCYNRIPAGERANLTAEKTPYSRVILHHRAAEYYNRARRPEAEWTRFDDIQTLIGEIENRTAATEYDTAAQTLALIDGAYLFRWGFYRYALDLHLALYGKVETPDDNIRQVRFLGACYWRLGHLANARKYFQMSLDLAQAADNREGEFAAWNALSLVAEGEGDSAEAIQNGERALAAARELGKREEEGMILHNLSIAYGGLGQVEQAIQTDEAALVIARELDDREGVGLCLIHLAELYCDQGRYDEATTRALEGQQIGLELKSMEISNISDYIQSLAHLFSGNLQAAQEAGEAGRRYQYPANDHNVLAALGTVYLRLGRVDAARDAFQNVLQIRDAGEMETQDLLDASGLALCGLALCGESGRVDEAVSAYQKAREASNDTGLSTRARRLFNALAAADEGGSLTRVGGLWSVN